jgi:hypothetical protein
LPTVIAPTHSCGAELAATEELTLSFPEPLAPPVIEIQLLAVEVVRAQPAPLVTFVGVSVTCFLSYEIFAFDW